MASLRARHGTRCALNGRETAAPQTERQRIEGCTCRPVYNIKGSSGKGFERVGRDLRDAHRALRKWQVLEDAGEVAVTDRTTFRAWGDTWLSALERKPGTPRGYRSTINYASDVFGDKAVRKVSSSDVVAFNALLREKKLSDSTRAKHLRVLGACLNSAVSHGKAAHNPVKRIPAGEKPRPKRKESAYFTNAEVPQLIAAMPEGLYRTLALVALKTGMRIGELSALTWQDVDLAGGLIRVRRTYTDGALDESPKNHERRTVDITDDLVELLGAWWGECGKPDDEELVFQQEGVGGFLREQAVLRQGLYPAMKRVGVARVGPTGEKRTFHSLRHTFAKRALETGRQVTWLSRHLGHSSLKVTTDVYGHWERETAKQEAAQMAGVFGV